VLYNHTGKFRQFDPYGYQKDWSYEYQNGKLIRKTKWCKNHIIKDEIYVHDDKTKTHYVVRWYSPDHKMYEEKYINSKKAGFWSNWYSSGHKLSEEQYIDGKKPRIWTYWGPNGKKINEKHYIDDMMINIIYFNC
jgi:antitoxin component YwqK of YwqJK toxin-antitoxin module